MDAFDRFGAVSLPQGSVYLRLEDDSTSYVSCPNRSSLGITGDTDVRIDVQPSNYGATCVLAAKDNQSTNQESWDLS